MEFQFQTADYTAQYVQVVQQEKMNIINKTNSTSDLMGSNLAIDRKKVREI